MKFFSFIDTNERLRRREACAAGVDRVWVRGLRRVIVWLPDTGWGEVQYR